MRSLSLIFVAALPALAAAQSPIEFNRDVRPILSNACFLCHGPDKAGRKGDLRLDIDQDVYADRDGTRIIVAGKPAESELYKRLVTHEAGKKMPPKKVNKDLTEKEIATVKTWIEQGGKYQKHWSLIAPQKVAMPKVSDEAWAKSPIDRFLLARLDKEGLKPSPAADRRTLLRRLSFDLTGLPPSPEEVDAFVNDKAADAYEKQVDRLLGSKHFGERMALYWLDLVRFADSAGYHSDNHREITPFRDWVIAAFNDNMPYNQFVTEQLAGDLIPNATAAQKVASGYNRLLQTTEEGGAQAKEYTAKYFADRVRNASTVYLGLTLGCTECHNHPYDPFTTKEFYQFGAFFADINEVAVGRQPQTTLLSPEAEAKIKAIDADIALVSKSLAEKEAGGKLQAEWEKSVTDAGFKGVAKDVEAILRLDPAKRNPKQKEAVVSFFRSQSPDLKTLGEQLTAHQKTKAGIQGSQTQTLVSMSGAPRTVRILPRGNWLDDTGEIVQPGTPGSLPPMPAKADPKARFNRLDLARWMTADDNPLASRAFVNRLWMLTFGQGLVKTLDDLGSQGAWPSHPELLDWLAIDFQTNGWDVKRAVKQLVTSNAYRQSSVASKEHKQRDPYNALIAHQSRYRLDAEFVRDNALAIGGLLVDKVGGPSVKPYQPAGYWKYLNFPTRDWAHDKNENQYRRGLYTYWQRSFLQPSLLAFDAPTREECTVERPRSNTPQQALVLLNDPTYVEASRAFAERLLKTNGDVPARIQSAYRIALQRPASADEIAILTKLYQSQKEFFTANAKDADAFLRIGERPRPANVDVADLAAWTQVARAVMNMHETITRN